MSEDPNTKTFQCTHCGSGIQIPADLPATTAPCPKCGEKVTSPGPEVARVPASASPAQAEVATTARQAQQEPSAPADAAASSKKSLIPWIAGLVALVILATAAAVVFLGPKPAKVETAEGEEETGLTVKQREDYAYRTKGWITEAEEVLAKFYQSGNIAEQAATTIRGSQNEAEMAAIYEKREEKGFRTPVSVFSPVSLNDPDTERGIFLMAYSRPEQFAIRSFFRPIPPLRVKHGLEAPDAFFSFESFRE